MRWMGRLRLRAGEKAEKKAARMNDPLLDGLSLSLSVALPVLSRSPQTHMQMAKAAAP